jgi:C-terminal processing protease CtpA/Prc
MGSFVAAAALALFIFAMSHAAALHRFPGSIGRLQAATAGSQRNPGVADTAEDAEEKARSANALESCNFQKLEEHPGNIGYVKLSWFADPSRCRPVAAAVMQRLSETDAVIFDLRDAHGGYPEMVRWMAGWLFAHPAAWYNPRATSASQSMTDSPVPESRLADKPVFILTSSHTFSGAEHFAYNLKMLKRATIVGETTSGASHAGAGPPQSANGTADPKPAWEGSGVQPDVRVDADDALRTAERLALKAIGKK